VCPGAVANEINGVKYYKPMMIYPAIHYTMGGIWVDYELQTTIPGLFAIGECNFSDHGANRLGASALMQGLADGYFVLPYTIQNYLADQAVWPKVPTDRPEFAEAEKKDSLRARDDDELQKTVHTASLILKGLVARDLWDMSEYFQVIYEEDPVVQQALKLLCQPSDD
jgi:succinate dehydrogenase/fumarate reductase flavoprotein subunit